MLRPWDIHIVIDRAAAAPAWAQIADELTQAMRQRRLPVGSVLPGTRDLAGRIGVNRDTVRQAYDELAAQGWLTVDSTRGTIVAALPPAAPPGEDAAETGAALPAKAAYAPRGATPGLLHAADPPGHLRFDDGAPDTRLMPAELVARAWRTGFLIRARRNGLGYGDPRGSFSIREQVAVMLRADRGITCGPENICITRGSQMGIFLAARLLVGPGDAAAFDALSYPPARAAFAAAGAATVAVPLDAQGTLTEALPALCAAHPIRALYTTPHHQFPTTVALAQNRRAALLRAAETQGFVVVEDDYDHEFHYAHRPLLPLASAAGFARLIYIGSLSKLLAPSLRIGYLVAAPEIIDRAAAEIMMIDRQGDPATEAAAAQLMESGAIKSHTRKVLRIYAQRRDLLAAALQETFDGEVSFSVPQGGLALWLDFAAGTDVRALADAAAAVKLGLTPGTAYATNGTRTNGARLGFGSLDEAELAQAVRRLAQAVRA